MSNKQKETPSQTAGPFLHIGMVPTAAGRGMEKMADPTLLSEPNSMGERIRIEGEIVDGTGAMVKDALVEIWQADTSGRYDGNSFHGWARSVTDFSTGRFFFETVKPGVTPFHDGRPQAPHILLSIFARGINLHLQTRMYFSDEASANATDPILQMLGESDLVATLIGQRDDGGDMPVYRFRICLQGDHETVFFDV